MRLVWHSLHPGQRTGPCDRGLARPPWVLPRNVDEPATEIAASDASPDLTSIPDLNAPTLLSDLPDRTVNADLGNAALVGGGALGIAVKPNPALLGSAAELVIASVGETPNAN